MGRLHSVEARRALGRRYLSSSRPLSAPAPPFWRSATSFETSSCPTISTRRGSRRAGANWGLPTMCRAPRPRCARSCSGWPTPRARMSELALARTPHARKQHQAPRPWLPALDALARSSRCCLSCCTAPRRQLKHEHGRVPLVCARRLNSVLACRAQVDLVRAEADRAHRHPRGQGRRRGSEGGSPPSGARGTPNSRANRTLSMDTSCSNEPDGRADDCKLFNQSSDDS